MTQQLIDREAVLRLLREMADRQFGKSHADLFYEGWAKAIASLPVETAQATSAEGRAEYEAMQKDWAKRVPKPDLLRAPQQATSEERETLIRFLLGSGPLDGVWFGEKHPTERGAFWWRKYLPLLRAPQQQEQSGNLPAPRTDPA